MSQRITKDTIDFLKAQFNIRTQHDINKVNEAKDRYRTIVKNFGEKKEEIVRALRKEMSFWLLDVQKLDLINKLKGAQKTSFQTQQSNVRKWRGEVVTQLNKAKAELKIMFDNDVTQKCPVTDNIDTIDSVTTNLASVSFTGLDNIENIVKECQKKVNEYYKASRNKFEAIRVKYRPLFDTAKDQVSQLRLNAQRLRQASTTDEKWDYNDNIFDILIRNNEDLITALVGKFPADQNKNILTGMEVTC